MHLITLQRNNTEYRSMVFGDLDTYPNTRRHLADNIFVCINDRILLSPRKK